MKFDVAGKDADAHAFGIYADAVRAEGGVEGVREEALEHVRGRREWRCGARGRAGDGRARRNCPTRAGRSTVERSEGSFGDGAFDGETTWLDGDGDALRDPCRA